MSLEYEAIYYAALRQDKNALNEALKDNVINLYEMRQFNVSLKTTHCIVSPVMQLAAENNKEAVEFLLQHRASKHDALRGYAMCNSPEEKNYFDKENYASIRAAVFGRAFSGRVQDVNALMQIYKKDNLFIREAVHGYIFGNHQNAARKIAPASMLNGVLAFNYGMQGNKSKIESLLTHAKQKDEIMNGAVSGFGVGGRIDLLDAFIKNKNKLYSDKNTQVKLLIKGGHIREVENCLLTSDANECQSILMIAIEEFASNGRYKMMQTFLDRLAAHPNALYEGKKSAIKGLLARDAYNVIILRFNILLRRKLFKEIAALEAYSEEVREEGDDKKCNAVLQFTTTIREEILDYCLGKNDRQTALTKLNQLLTDNANLIKDDRTITNIVLHIAFALTGIGLIVMLGKKLFYKDHSFFIDQSKPRRMLTDLETEFRKACSL